MNTISSENPLTTQDYLQQGNRLRKVGKLEEAINVYSMALQNNPHCIPVLKQLAEIYEEQKDFETAIRYIEQVLTLQPDNRSEQAQLAKFKLKQGKFQEAIAILKEVIYLDKLSIKTYKIFADYLAKRGNLSKAIKVYKQALNFPAIQGLDASLLEIFYTSFGDTIIQLGVHQNRLNNCVHCFQTACEEYPNNPWLHYYLGTAISRQDRFEEALVCYKKAISIEPNLYQAYFQMGQAFGQVGNWDEEFQCYIKALQIKPNDRRANRSCHVWFNQIGTQLTSQQLDERIQAYLSVMEGLEKSTILYAKVGSVLLKLGKVSEGISYNQKACYHQLEKSKPEFIEHWWEKGKLIGPQFLLIGVAKCGTTSLYDYMTQHPQILPAKQKELRFLSWAIHQIGREELMNTNFHLPPSYREMYCSQFPPISQQGNYITGEATPGYINTPDLEKLLSKSFPDVKLIVILRNPVKRSLSHYYMDLREAKVKQSFEEIIELEIERLNSGENILELLNKPQQHSHYLNYGLYTYALERWMKFLPREQLLVLQSEELASNPDPVMSQIFEFLNVPAFGDIKYPSKNKGSYSSKIDESLLTRLYDFYRPHNKRLEELIGRKFNWE